MRGSARSFRTVLGLAVLCALAGCASHEVPAGANPDLDDREGLVAIVVDAPTAIERMTFAPRGGSIQVSLAKVAPAEDLRILRLPAGEYCLDAIEYDVEGLGITEGICFEVVERVLRYPGHLVIERVEDLHLSHSANFRWEARDDDYQWLLGRRWPQLATHPPAPEEEAFVPPEPEHDVFEDEAERGGAPDSGG